MLVIKSSKPIQLIGKMLNKRLHATELQVLVSELSLVHQQLMILESGETEELGDRSASEAVPAKTDDAEADEEGQDGLEEDGGQIMQASYDSALQYMYTKHN